MSKNCPFCQVLIDDDAKFCGNCGAQLPVDNMPPAQTLDYGYAGAPAYEPLPVGYSDKVNDPELIAAVKKNKKLGGVFAVIVVLLPFVGVTAYSAFSDNMELKKGIVYGAVLSFIFLLFAVFSALKNRASNEYDAVVTDKKTRTRHRQSGSNSDHMESYTEFITYAKTMDGKKKKIVEQEGHRVIAYNYLQIGDRFKFHPQFNFQYEHYDKSRAPYIGCVACGTQNPVSADRCEKCGIPLLK